MGKIANLSKPQRSNEIVRLLEGRIDDMGKLLSQLPPLPEVLAVAIMKGSLAALG